MKAKNIYSDTFEYNTNNPNAISDGDEKGRGENSAYPFIGTRTDILGNALGPGRLGLKAKNIYSDTFEYNVNNPNAISDGDERGRGESGSGQIGTNTDIFGNAIGPGRIDQLAKNKYTALKSYPDF